MYKKYLDKDLFEIIKYDEGANYWLIVIKIFKEIDTLKLTKHMSFKNIEIRPVWFPLHLQKYANKYQNIKYKMLIKFTKNIYVFHQVFL